MEMMAEGLTGNSKAAAELSDSMRETVREVYALSLANEEATSTLEDVDDALTELKGNVDRREAWRNLIDEIDKVKDAAIEAFVEGTPAAIRESESSLDRLRVELAEYIAETEGIPTEKKTDFLARLETANLQEIEAIFNQLGRPRTVAFIPTVSGIPIGPGETPSEVLGRRSLSLAGRPGVGNVTVNVAGSVVAERDLVNSVRKGLIDSQRNGAPLVYSNS
jgi:nitrate reductase assembly molybdenum cofactor insertion protein NarJ